MATARRAQRALCPGAKSSTIGAIPHAACSLTIHCVAIRCFHTNPHLTEGQAAVHYLGLRSGACAGFYDCRIVDRVSPAVRFLRRNADAPWFAEVLGGTTGVLGFSLPDQPFHGFRGSVSVRTAGRASCAAMVGPPIKPAGRRARRSHTTAVHHNRLPAPSPSSVGWMARVSLLFCWVFGGRAGSVCPACTAQRMPTSWAGPAVAQPHARCPFPPV